MTMMNDDLIDIFDDCLDRLAAGETVEQCLRRYAAYDAALRPLLQTVRLAQRALPDYDEVAPAQARGRARLLAELGETSAPGRRLVITTGWWLAVAALLLVCFGVGAMTLNSLPGDTLYGLKRHAEAALIELSGNNADAIEAARQRRIDEVYLLIALGRPANVDFEGQVEGIMPDVWRVSGLTLTVGSETLLDEAIWLGDDVTVNADVTFDRRVVARQIHLLQPGNLDEMPQPTPLPTNAVTLTPTATMTLALTETPLSTEPVEPATVTGQPTTPVPPTLTPAVTRIVVTATTALVGSTATPAATATTGGFIASTWTPVPTRTPSPIPAETLLPAQRANCTTLRPSGWVTYNVRSGDSLSGLATSTGTSISMIMQLNCLPESGLIRAGQLLYLPSNPPTRLPVSTSVPAGGDVINPPAPQQSSLSAGNGDDSSGARSGSNSGSESDDDASNNWGDNSSNTGSGDNSS